MTDLSPILSSLLAPHKTHLSPSAYHPSKLRDDFLKEAYSINSHISTLRTHLFSIRSAYLSTTPPSHIHHSRATRSPSQKPLTNADRDALDASSKTLLRDVNASITQLSSAETARQELVQASLKRKRGIFSKGRLGRWAAGDDAGGEEDVEMEGADGAEETSRRWREGVLWYLKKKLEEAGALQREMMERRIEREIERGKSTLSGGGMNGGIGPSSYTSSKGRYGRNAGGAAGSYQNAALLDEITGATPSSSSSSSAPPSAQNGTLSSPSQSKLLQQQTLEAENSALLSHYTSSLTQIATAERSLLEISELQSQLVANLEVQGAQVEQLVSDGLQTAENVGGGNKQLKKASERRSVARGVFWATVGLCGGLVVWDLIF